MGLYSGRLPGARSICAEGAEARAALCPPRLQGKERIAMEKQTTYTSKIGDTTFIVNNSFTGTKTLADAFEEIILAAFRERYGGSEASYQQVKSLCNNP